MDKYVYIDESGDLGENGSKYFIITAVWIDKPEIFDRLIKNIRRYKFHSELKKTQEIKANNSSNSLKEYVLKEFTKIYSVHSQSIILEKSKLKNNYLQKDKNKLYNYVAGRLANIAIDSKKLIIRIDKSKGKRSLRDDFDKYLIEKFKEARWVRDIEIYHSWSHSWSGLQVADMISWAVFQKFESNNDYYFKIIEKKVNIDYFCN